MTTSGTVAVVGLGYAGRRFATVLQEARDRGEIAALALVDRDPARTAPLPHDRTYTDLGDCLVRFDPSHVCVCTNERDHYETFTRLESHGGRDVISEKPLLTPDDDVDDATALLARHRLRMNLLERHSPALRVLAQWRDGAGPRQEVRQIESFWGKHRVHDPRPTMGVLSELVHPLDLSLILAGAGTFHVHSVTGRPCTWASSPWCDSIDVTANVDGVPVTIHSSFSWSRRDRRVVLLLEVDGVLHRAMLAFDNPHWDQDQLLVERILGNGRCETVLTWESPESVTGSDGLNKLRRSVDSWLRADSVLPDTGDALRLQRILGDIDGAYGAVAGR